MSELTPEQILRLNNRIKKNAEERAGINSEKVQQTVSSYLQMARDNQLNYNEFLRVVEISKELILQSLNKVAISTLPNIISDAAKL